MSHNFIILLSYFCHNFSHKITAICDEILTPIFIFFSTWFYLCMCCVCACMRECMHACMHAIVHVREFVCMCICMCLTCVYTITIIISGQPILKLVFSSAVHMLW